MDERDISIASLRRQVNQLNSKCSALEQENALLNEEIDRLKRKLRQATEKY